MEGKGVNWSLEELVDFEISLADEAVPNRDIGQEMRREIRAEGGLETDLAKRRWGLKYWLLWVTSKGEGSPGRRVVTISQILGLFLFILMLLTGVGVVRGLLSDYQYESGPYLIEEGSGGIEAQGQEVEARGFNLWVFLAVTLGLQWLLILASVIGYLLFRKWSVGLKGILSGLIKRFVSGVDQGQWKALLAEKGSHKSALTWRLSRILQLGGVGYNAGLLCGLFGLLWFSNVGFFWETTLPIGAPSLDKTTEVLAAPWGGERPTSAVIELTQLRNESDYRFEPEGEELSIPIRAQANLAWAGFLFLAIGVWGLLPRCLFLVISVWKEKSVLAKLDFQDRSHRKLWRELSHVERRVTMEGIQDGVVLCDVGGIGVATDVLRPFLLQTLRVNPEKRFTVDVLDQAEEKAAWQAMREAPCGVIILVEGWNLSPKQFASLWKRMRREAGDESVIRVLILGEIADGKVSSPVEDEVKEWRRFIDTLRDPLMECLAYDANSLIKE